MRHFLRNAGNFFFWKYFENFQNDKTKRNNFPFLFSLTLSINQIYLCVSLSHDIDCAEQQQHNKQHSTTTDRDHLDDDDGSSR